MKKKRDQIRPWQDLPPAVGEGALYLRLAEQIRAAIRSGRFREGAYLPSKRNLANSLDLSLTTVTAAYDTLCAEGYLESRPRSGYLVGQVAELYLRGRVQPEGQADTKNQIGLKKSEKTGTKIQIDLKETEKDGTKNQIKVENSEKGRLCYDFGYRGVDESLYPERSVKRIYRRLIDAGALHLDVDPHGYHRLREEIAAFLGETRGIWVQPEDILISYGSQGLYRFLLELLPVGTAYILEDPGFPMLYRNIVHSGRRFYFLPVDEKGWGTPPACEEAICFLTPSHQFPSGREMSLGERRRFLDWAAAAPGRYLLEDDYDGDFRYVRGPESLSRLAQAAGPAAAKVLYLGSFSKSWSPGLRLSYLCLPSELRARARQLGLPSASPVPSLEQAFMAELLSSGGFERHLNRARRLYRLKRDRLVAALKASALDWQLQRAVCGLHLNYRLPRDVDAEALAAFLEQAQAAGCRLQCTADFSCEALSPPELMLGFARLPLESIGPAVEALAAVWRERRRPEVD